MKSFILKCILSFSLAIPGFAQDSTTVEVPVEESTALKVSGSGDIYYKYDFSGQPNIGTSFANDHNSFSIGMLNVIAEKTIGKIYFVADVALGPRNAQSVGPSDSEFQPGIQNLYVSYKLTDKLNVTAGYMGTFVGYEVISPTGNFNYSTSYLFTNGPFQNAGLKLQYDFSDRVSLMAGVFNDWNVYNQPDGVNINSFGGQLYVSPVNGMDVYFNGITGGSNGSEFDITAGYQISDLFYVGLNAASWSYEIPETPDVASFKGGALYFQSAFSESFAVGLRGEVFSTENTGYIGYAPVSGDEATSVTAITLSANIGGGNLRFIPEFRIDSASEDVFLDSDSNATGTAAQVLGALVFSF